MLVLRPGALGDALLAVPALRALRRRYGAERLTFAAHLGAARLLASLGEVDRALAFDDSSLRWVFSSRGVGPEHDKAIVAWFDGAGLPALSGALVVAPGRPPEAGDRAQHCARYLLETLALTGVGRAFDDRPLAVAPAPSGEVLIHPGSGGLAKNWPAAQFAEVIRALGGPIRLIVGEADTQAAAAVELALGSELPRLEQAPLAELAARLAGCRAYLGNDSGISHLAGLCGARTVAIFGPTSPVVWSPLGPNVSVESFGADPARVASLLCG